MRVEMTDWINDQWFTYTACNSKAPLSNVVGLWLGQVGPGWTIFSMCSNQVDKLVMS